MKRNVPILGFIIGLLLPLLGVFLLYLAWGEHSGLGNFIKYLPSQPGLASKVLTLSLLLNLIPFVYCTSKRIDLTARGIFIATMLYALVVIFIKFIW